MLKTTQRKPYPLSWEEQERLMAELPQHLANMVLFAVNTGWREREITGLQWQDEIPFSSAFVLPEHRSKNGEERIIALNSIAQSIINQQRGKHPQFFYL